MARGSLRIYLGAAPGVGKTYAMLNEGRRLARAGTDVVVALVETHGRAETAAQVGDLEVVPRQVVAYRGTLLEEMDLDAVLARAPGVALVDELAHTNAPGGRHAKRWQDVDALLEAGIDVIGTLNVQHIESLNDVVAGITGVRQQESIPDAFVRAADQLQIVDLPPDALRRRLAQGLVYGPERIDAALRNYFRPGNLGALREIALLWVADRVDDALRRYRTEQGITGEWETRERVLVAMTGGEDGSDALIRRAARVAARLKGDLIGVHVEAADGLARDPSARLQEHRRLLEALGGTYIEVVGADVPAALLQVARAENCTQIVLGASRRSRLTELLQGSVINRVTRDSGTIDVLVVSRLDEGGQLREPSPRRRRRARRAAISTRRQVAALLLAAAGLPLLTAVLVPLRDGLARPTVPLLYLLITIGAAVIGGIVPALAAAVAGSLLVDFFFIAPYGTLRIGAPAEAFTVAAFLVLGGVVSWVVDRSARQALEAGRARAEAETLAGLAAPPGLDADPLAAVVERLQATFALDAVAVLHRHDGTWHQEAAAGTDAPRTPAEADDTIAVDSDLVVALRGTILAEERRVLSIFAGQVGQAVRGREMRAQAAEAATLAEANALRTALLSAVSHDLRTPLATIKASVSSLLDPEVDWPADEERRFLHSISLETDRLNRLVGNLLDMSRIQAGAVDLLIRPVGLDEVVPHALAGLPAYGATVVTAVPETLPMVLADPALLERAIANLVENALRHAPPGTTVRVTADRDDGVVELRIVDRGPGIPESERERVFRPFQRLGDARPGGAGLGLAIARGFVEAMGGTLTIDDTPGGGTTVAVRLPRRGDGEGAVVPAGRAGARGSRAAAGGAVVGGAVVGGGAGGPGAGGLGAGGRAAGGGAVVGGVAGEPGAGGRGVVGGGAGGRGVGGRRP